MSDEAVAKSGSKVRGRPFQKGQSGNPAGRPLGCRNKASILLGELIDGQGKAIVAAMIKAALDGDTAAGRCLIERLVPPRKDRAISFALPPLESAADGPRALAAIAAAVAAGDLTAPEAADLSRLIADFSKSVEVADLAARVAALEAAQ